MATRNNDKDGVKITGTAKADKITNHGANNVSINAGAGNDSVTVEGGHNVTVSGGTGNDFFHREWGAGTTYIYTSGNDTIENFTQPTFLVIADSWSSIRGSDGSSVIINIKNKGTITLVEPYYDLFKIVSSLADVNHYNLNWNDNANKTVEGTKKDDYIYNGGNKVRINAGAGDDFIDNFGNNVTIDAGDGNNYIAGGGSNISISTGVGNDVLDLDGNNYKVRTGTGDDFIENGDWSSKGRNSTIDTGEGNDIVKNTQGTSKVSINGGKGNDSIENWGNHTTIDSGDGNDYIESYREGGEYSSLVGGAGNDSIKNHAPHSTVIGGKGNDYILNYDSYVSINAGDGADYTENYGNEVNIDGGEGNDLIYNYGFNMTIMGGKGNDTVWNNEAGMVYVYKPGEGNDFISGFGTLETLVIDGAKFTTLKSGSDVLVNVGKNTITLQGAASLAKVNITTSTKGIVPVNVISNYESDVAVNGMVSSNWIRNYADKVTINSGSGIDDIYNSGSNVVIKGGGGYDQIRSYASDVLILGGSKVDKITSGGGDNVTINAGAGNDIIDAYGGVNLFIRGGKGNDTINLGSAHGIFTYAKNEGNDIISKGAIINLINGAIINETITSGSDTVLKIGKGSITVKDTKPEEIIVVKNNKYSDYLVNVLNNKAQGKIIGKSSATATQKISNYGEASTIIGGKGIDSIYNEASNSSINAGAGDDYLQIGDYNISGVTALGGTGNDTIYNNGKNTSINAGVGNDTIISEGNSENVTIDGGKGHDVIEVQGIDYIVRGGSGNDTVNLSLGRNNTEYVFEYAKGDGNDVLSKGAVISLINGAKISQSLMSGSDAILKIDNGSITFKDTKLADVQIVKDGDYEKFFGYDEISNSTPGKVVTIGTRVHRKSKMQNNADNATIQGSDWNDTIDSWGKNVSINAGNGNNYINSYSVNGTIIAGSGDDIVYTTNNDNDRNYIELGGGANYIYNNGTNTTIKSDSTEGDTIYTCSNSENNLIICGNAHNTLEINGAHSTVKGGTTPEIMEFYADSGLADGDAGDDYIYKAGLEYYDFNEALEKMSKAIRDASKEQLEDILIQFDTNPNLKSVIEQGEKSPVFADMDKESAKKIADAVKVSKEFAEASLAYEADGKGTHFAHYLKEEAIPNAKKFTEGTGIVFAYIESGFTGEILEGITYAKEGMDAFKKAGTVGNVISGALAVGDIGLNYVSYSEAAEFYEKKRQSVIDNMSEENLAESLKQLEEIDKARGKEGAKVVASGIDAVGTGVGIAASMALVGKGAVAGAAIGSAIPGIGTAAGAVIGGGLTAIGIAVSTGALTDWAKRSYLNRDHPYAGNIPTWNEITGKKSNVQNSNALMSESNDVVLYDIAPEVATTTLKGAAGNDALANKDELVLMTGGTGNDFLVNHGNKVTLQGDSGDDYISNTGDSASINTGKGHDLIENAGNNITVETGAGDDYVANEGDNVTINALVGNNTINSYAGENIYIVAGSGSDSIVNALGSNIKIFSGDGNNVLENYGGENVIIKTGKGTDIVVNYSDNVSINAGNGDNLILSDGDSNTILSGTGDDIIILEENNTNTLIKYSSGKDTIYGLDKTSTLQIGNGKGTYSTTISDKDIILTVGKGKITLDNVVDLPSLNINKKDIMSLTLNNNSKSTVTLESAIKTADASKRTKAVNITGNGFANTIIGGKGNDSLSGGKGNDSLWGDDGADKFFYAKGDGKDIIYGFDDNDTLTLDNLDFTASYNKSKGTIALNVDSGSITFKDFTATNFHINDDVYKISGSQFKKK